MYCLPPRRHLLLSTPRLPTGSLSVLGGGEVLTLLLRLVVACLAVVKGRPPLRVESEAASTLCDRLAHILHQDCDQNTHVHHGHLGDRVVSSTTSAAGQLVELLQNVSIIIGPRCNWGPIYGS